MSVSAQWKKTRQGDWQPAKPAYITQVWGARVRVCGEELGWAFYHRAIIHFLVNTEEKLSTSTLIALCRHNQSWNKGVLQFTSRPASVAFFPSRYWYFISAQMEILYHRAVVLWQHEIPTHLNNCCWAWPLKQKAICQAPLGRCSLPWANTGLGTFVHKQRRSTTPPITQPRLCPGHSVITYICHLSLNVMAGAWI